MFLEGCVDVGRRELRRHKRQLKVRVDARPREWKRRGTFEKGRSPGPGREHESYLKINLTFFARTGILPALPVDVLFYDILLTYYLTSFYNKFGGFNVVIGKNNS